MRKEIEISVLGKTLKFRLADNIREEEFYEIVNYVEEKINKIKNEINDLDSFKIGLLTSINITEELLQLKRENRHLKLLLDRIDKMVS